VIAVGDLNIAPLETDVWFDAVAAELESIREVGGIEDTTP
jgi:hypothetical protein